MAAAIAQGRSHKTSFRPLEFSTFQRETTSPMISHCLPLASCGSIVDRWIPLFGQCTCTAASPKHVASQMRCFTKSLQILTPLIRRFTKRGRHYCSPEITRNKQNSASSRLPLRSAGIRGISQYAFAVGGALSLLCGTLVACMW